jgi:hypothetical protein
MTTKFIKRVVIKVAVDWDEVKCWWCNARGCDKINKNGKVVHADCEEEDENEVRQCADCECPFTALKADPVDVCPRCDAEAKDLPYEECVKCGEVCVSPCGGTGYNEDGDWECRSCRK